MAGEGSSIKDASKEESTDLSTKGKDHKNAEEEGKYCSQHKLANMVKVGVGASTCENADCIKEPSFNFFGETKMRFCYDHKVEGMANVRHRLCDQFECQRRATHRFRTDTRNRYCSEHKLEGMEAGQRTVQRTKRKIDGFLNLTLTPMLLITLAMKKKKPKCSQLV
mmetsp:Transcript_16181/g.20353  ORF Transcript_16181/g.20353 Transcript_16181/m.20353 type:complete len:166 (+) Transcript_16181:149-646(+)|eukprot:CAMPEP_0117745922 /NCGR_PEP_ID=MMETSP0947-20121206/7651_1 /TAXON_ID=44440 /ORGANISM="Chattonella subsalsa, Strain CCMP2191" /LENGTH=165 /DNA_ID=CAMNT_0005563171 /DNA_START=20 /DNA_END=517 /DNA_ORIENTATION=+